MAKDGVRFFFFSISHHLVHQDSGQFSSLACSGDPRPCLLHGNYKWITLPTQNLHGWWGFEFRSPYLTSFTLWVSPAPTHTHTWAHTDTHTRVCACTRPCTYIYFKTESHIGQVVLGLWNRGWTWTLGPPASISEVLITWLYRVW